MDSTFPRYVPSGAPNQNTKTTTKYRANKMWVPCPKPRPHKQSGLGTHSKESTKIQKKSGHNILTQAGNGN